jgi:hypothetical protein
MKQEVTNTDRIEEITGGWELLGQLEYVGQSACRKILNNFAKDFDTFEQQQRQKLSMQDSTEETSLSHMLSMKQTELFESKLLDHFKGKQILGTIKIQPVLRSLQEAFAVKQREIDATSNAWLDKHLTARTINEGGLNPNHKGIHSCFPLASFLFSFETVQKESSWQTIIEILETELKKQVPTISAQLLSFLCPKNDPKFQNAVSNFQKYGNNKIEEQLLLISRKGISVTSLNKMFHDAKAHFVVNLVLTKITSRNPEAIKAQLREYIRYAMKSVLEFFEMLVEGTLKKNVEAFMDRFLIQKGNLAKQLAIGFFQDLTANYQDAGHKEFVETLSNISRTLHSFDKKIQAPDINVLGKEMAESLRKMSLLESIQASFDTRALPLRNQLLFPLDYCEVLEADLETIQSTFQDSLGIQHAQSLSSLEKTLAKFQLAVVPIPENSNSLFNSLADQMYQITDTHSCNLAKSLRFLILKYILQHYSHSTLQRADFNNRFKRSVRFYVEQMKDEHMHPDDLMLFFFVLVMKAPVNVWRIDGLPIQITGPKKPFNMYAVNIALVCNRGVRYFVSVKPTWEVKTGQFFPFGNNDSSKQNIPSRQLSL